MNKPFLTRDWHPNLASHSAFHGGNYNHELKSGDKCCPCDASLHASGRGATSCSNVLRPHSACVASVSVRKLTVVPFLAQPKPTIPFRGLFKRKRLLRRLATHGSDKSLLLYWRIFVKIFVSAAEFCRCNESHKFRLIWLFATCFCNICNKQQDL